MDVEVWRAVVDASSYDVSDRGRLRSWKSRNGRGGRVSVPRILDHGTVHGYPAACLQYDVGRRQRTRFVHSLVLEAFVGPCPEGMECLHFPDRTRTNCALTNLRWGTPTENAADREAHGTTARGERSGAASHPERIARGDRHGSRTKPEAVLRGQEHAHAVLTEEQAAAVIARHHDGEKGNAIASSLGVSRSCIDMIVYGYSWAHLPRPMDPKVERGKRHTRGEKNGRALLSERMASTIIGELAAGARPVDVFRSHRHEGVTQSLVNEVKSGRAWRHLPRPWLAAVHSATDVPSGISSE